MVPPAGRALRAARHVRRRRRRARSVLLALDRRFVGDWSRWDFAGGLHRGTDASAVVRVVGVQGSAAAHQIAEANGNARYETRLTSQRPRSACPAVKALVVVRQRVQAYSALATRRPHRARRARRARRRRVRGSGRGMYAKTSHDSAHVGDWFLRLKSRHGAPPSRCSSPRRTRKRRS